MQIEGNDISAIDVAHYLEVLKANINLRQQENYLDPDTETEINLLSESGAYDEDLIFGVFNQFYGK